MKNGADQSLERLQSPSSLMGKDLIQLRKLALL
jgi:hypothetical protein